MNKFRTAGCLVVLLLLSSPLVAEVKSGPKAASQVPALKVLVLDNNDDYKEQNVSAANKDKTAVYVFIQAEQWSRPMARFLRDLDKAAAGQKASVTAVWLTDDVDKSKRYLPRGRDALKLAETTFAVYGGNSAGPNDWSVASDAFLTAIVTNKGKVASTFGYVSVNETDVPKVVAGLKNAAGKKAE